LSRRIKNAIFTARDKLPLAAQPHADKALVAGYRLAARARKWREDCTPKGKAWLKRRVASKKLGKNLI